MRRWIASVTALVAVLALTGLALAGPAGARPATTGVDTAPITAGEAREAVGMYLDEAGLGHLSIGAMIEFSNHVYVVVTDPVTDDGAIEVTVGRDGAVHHQPTLMWNTIYHDLLAGHPAMTAEDMSAMMQEGRHHGMGGGAANSMQGMMHGGAGHSAMHGVTSQHMSGMMNGMAGAMHGAGHAHGDQMRQMAMDPSECLRHASTAPAETLDTPLTTDAARNVAQAWLDANDPGATAGDVTTFPGYFTVQSVSAGQMTGLVSVQTTTGTVIPQGWHGNSVSIT